MIPWPSYIKFLCIIYISGWTEGTYCGYQVARDTKFDLDKTMITYMTTGILLQKLIREKSLNDYTHVILDEVSW